LNTNETVGHDFLQLLRQLEDPRISIYLALLRRNLLTLEAIMKETGLSPDRMKRALAWMVRQGFLSRMYIYEKGTRKVAYHITGVTQTLTLQLEIDADTAKSYGFDGKREAS
jgi:predicted transcriptional regulator